MRPRNSSFTNSTEMSKRKDKESPKSKNPCKLGPGTLLGLLRSLPAVWRSIHQGGMKVHRAGFLAYSLDARGALGNFGNHSVQGGTLCLDCLVQLLAILLQMMDFGASVRNPILQFRLIVGQALDLMFNCSNPCVIAVAVFEFVDFLRDCGCHMVLQTLLDIIEPVLSMLRSNCWVSHGWRKAGPWVWPLMPRITGARPGSC